MKDRTQRETMGITSQRGMDRKGEAPIMADRINPETMTNEEKVAWANQQFTKKAGRKVKGTAKRSALKELMKIHKAEYDRLVVKFTATPAARK